jgi:hypothetical protein
MKTPRFDYYNGSSWVNFTPTFPATKRPPLNTVLSAVRHDSITSAGEKQSVFERIDQMIPLSFENVPQSDITSTPGWQDMFTNVLAGAEFVYYPDHTDLTTYDLVTLEDMDFKPKWVGWQNFSLSFNLRVYVS